jgi:hypothetical protein
VVAGGLLVNFQTWATRWVDNTPQMFMLHGASYAVNEAGTVIVGHYTPPATIGRAYRWTFNGLSGDAPLGLDLGTTPGPVPETRRSLAQGVSEDGSKVVGYALRYDATVPASQYPKVAFLWTEATGMVELNAYLPTVGVNLDGWDLRVANGISADGRVIVGTGIHNGLTRGFIVTLGNSPPCSYPDFNGDGDFGTDQDILAFFACLSGNCCPACIPNGGDFNGDGDFGTDQDIEAFFRYLSSGPC